MAKTPKLKSDPGSNPRSRASRRRATSPSTNTPKSLSDLSRASDSTPTLTKPPHLQHLQHSVQNGGITKTRPQSVREKKRSRQQRQRQERGLKKAESVLGKLERKVEESKRRVEVGRERRRGWEKVNGEGKRGVGGKDGESGDGEVAAEEEKEGEGRMEVEDDWEDEVDMNGVAHKNDDENFALSENMAVEGDGGGREENEEDKIT